MSDSAIILLVISAYLLLVLYIGAVAGRGRSNSTEEYIAGGRSLGFICMYFLMGGAIFSAFAYLGGPGWAFSKGAPAYYILAYCALGLIPWLVWGSKARAAGIKYGYLTQAQLLSDRFQSRALSIIIALVSTLAFIQYVSLQMKGSAYVFEIASGGKIPFWAGALIAYVIVLIYVFFGGVRGVAWTNVFQGAFMIVVAWVLGLYFCYSLYGGPTAMFEQIIAAKPTHLLIGDGTSMSFVGYSSAVFISVIGFSMWPHLFMKAYSADSKKTLRKTIVLYPTFAIMLVPVLLIGFAGIMQVTPEELGAPDKILPWMFSNMDFPAVAIGLVLAAALAAAMSSQDTITHAAGSIFAQDFIAVIKNKPTTDAEATMWVRIFVVTFGLVSYLVTIFGGQSIVALLLGAYGSIAQLFPLVFATFFWPRATRQGALAGIIVGVTFNYAITLNLIPKLWDINPGLQGLILNIAALIIVSYLTQPQEKEHVLKFTEL